MAEAKISAALERELDKVERECIRPLQVKIISLTLEVAMFSVMNIMLHAQCDLI